MLADRRLAGVLGELAVSHHAGEIAADGRQPLLDAVGGDIVKQHLVAGRRGDMRNAAAHLPGADDADSLDCHYTDPVQGLHGPFFVQCKLKGRGDFVHPGPRI